MESKIPLPTDSIYKFYALFGLLLFISSMASALYVSRSTNELLFVSAIEYETLAAIKNPAPVEVAKKIGINKRVEIALTDRKFLIYLIGVIAGGAIIFMIYGFRKWHRIIQPIQDEISRLQLEKLKFEIQDLRKRSKES